MAVYAKDPLLWIDDSARWNSLNLDWAPATAPLPEGHKVGMSSIDETDRRDMDWRSAIDLALEARAAELPWSF